MILPQQLIDLYNERTINYEALRKHPEYREDLIDWQRDLNVFIPVRGRSAFVGPCLRYMKAAASRSCMNIVVTLIENDKAPKHDRIAYRLGCDYIFIPTAACPNEAYQKALSYNMGYVRSKKCGWALYHDIDILVEPTYFELLKVYMDNPTTTWLQPYQDRRVLRLSAKATLDIMDIMDSEEPLDLPSLRSVPAKRGSPGGSILIRDRDFEAVGGYDPELFWSYAPEDAYLWTKLEIDHADIDHPMSTCMHFSGTYADDPIIEVYHLEHPSMADSNPHHGRMSDILSSLWTYSNETRKNIVAHKAALFERSL